MKLVDLMPVVDAEKCKGCKTCMRVCPTLAVKMEEKLAVVDLDRCRGCGNCEQRCPEYAIGMVRRPEPVMVGVNLDELDYEKIKELCLKARFNPEQTVCYCTARAPTRLPEPLCWGQRRPRISPHDRSSDRMQSGMYRTGFCDCSKPQESSPSRSPAVGNGMAELLLPGRFRNM